ncbi:IS66 family insertion sequence element accessory protein TnpB [Bacteroides fragilis]|nr:IS66 family insertion sequence element accessory protein TnpB [Bacteroides fragilis]
MYSYNDFERLFLRYKLEGVPSGVSIEQFCLSNQVPYNLFPKWYKDTRKKIVPIQVLGAPSPEAEMQEISSPLPEGTPEVDTRLSSSTGLRILGGHPHDQRCSYQSEKFKLRRLEKSGRETGGLMLNITGLNRFFFVRDFHDMRCKYDKVLSIIHQQLNREPEDGDVFIVMSKDLRLVRLFSYDQLSYSMFEKRFRPRYKFMHVTAFFRKEA